MPSSTVAPIAIAQSAAIIRDLRLIRELTSILMNIPRLVISNHRAVLKK
jgi:hypothetical protein